MLKRNRDSSVQKFFECSPCVSVRTFVENICNVRWEYVTQIWHFQNKFCKCQVLNAFLLEEFRTLSGTDSFCINIYCELQCDSTTLRFAFSIAMRDLQFSVFLNVLSGPNGGWTTKGPRVTTRRSSMSYNDDGDELDSNDSESSSSTGMCMFHSTDYCTVNVKNVRQDNWRAVNKYFAIFYKHRTFLPSGDFRWSSVLLSLLRSTLHRAIYSFCSFSDMHLPTPKRAIKIQQ